MYCANCKAHEPEQVTEVESEGTGKMQGALYFEEVEGRQRALYFISTYMAYFLELMKKVKNKVWETGDS